MTLLHAQHIEAILREHPEIENFATYIGEGGPRFHITVMPQRNNFV